MYLSPFIFTKTKVQTDLKLYHQMTIDWMLVGAQMALGHLSVIPVIRGKHLCDPQNSFWNKGTCKMIT